MPLYDSATRYDDSATHYDDAATQASGGALPESVFRKAPFRGAPRTYRHVADTRLEFFSFATVAKLKCPVPAVGFDLQSAAGIRFEQFPHREPIAFQHSATLAANFSSQCHCRFVKAASRELRQHDDEMVALIISLLG